MTVYTSASRAEAQQVRLVVDRVAALVVSAAIYAQHGRAKQAQANRDMADDLIAGTPIEDMLADLFTRVAPPLTWCPQCDRVHDLSHTCTTGATTTDLVAS